MLKKRKIWVLLIPLFSFLSVISSRAETFTNQEAHQLNLNTSVEYLLSYIRSSNLTFVRNGNTFSSDIAAEHIKHKYEYNKKDIHSAEDFIELAATKSSLTGEPYLVNIGDGTSKPVADWLAEELARYRKSNVRGEF
jgi:hypothetical protein